MKNSLRAALGLIAASVLLAGCTKYADQSQMQQLDNIKNEIATLQQQVTNAEQQKADLQKQVADKQQQIKTLQSNEQLLQQRLQEQQTPSGTN
jgi:septal ring factor EnvC (AmiA/AmiB activator)